MKCEMLNNVKLPSARDYYCTIFTPSKTDPTYELNRRAGGLGATGVTQGQPLGVDNHNPLCHVSQSPQAEWLSPQGRGGPEQNPLLQGAYQL